MFSRSLACFQRTKVYHDGMGANGDQRMSFTLVDVDNRKSLAQSLLPLTPGSQLTWIGFSESGLPGMVDSEEVMRVFVQGLSAVLIGKLLIKAEWGMTWTPIAEFKTIKTEVDSFICAGHLMS